MALIKCPECGKEVSDIATSCPSCGYKVKKYVEESKKQSKAKEQKEKRKNPSSIGIIIASAIILLFIIIIVFAIKKKQQDEYAVTQVSLLIYQTEDIAEYKKYAIMKLQDGSYIYMMSRVLTMQLVKYIKYYLPFIMLLNIWMNIIQILEALLIKKIKTETHYSCKTWEDYKERLTSYYFLDADLTDYERAEKIVAKYVEKNLK